jgi:hypothetical protein
MTKKFFLILIIVVIIISAGFLFLFFKKEKTTFQTNTALTNVLVGNQNKNLNTNIATTTPVFLDTDHDGLTNEAEKELGTDPNNKDTDNDGLIDGADGGKFFKTDPLNPDSDGDGYKDGEEVLKGYDPTKKDARMPAGPPPGSAGWEEYVEKI